MNLKVVLGFAACLAFSAGRPVGVASSPAPFELAGTAVRPEGVPSWPLMGGQTIKAGAKDVVIKLSDGSRVVLNPQAKAATEESGSGIAFRLLSGSMLILPAERSNVTFYKNSERISARPAVEVAVSTEPVPQTPARALDRSARLPPAPVSSR